MITKEEKNKDNININLNFFIILIKKLLKEIFYLIRLITYNWLLEDNQYAKYL